MFFRCAFVNCLKRLAAAFLLIAAAASPGLAQKQPLSLSPLFNRINITPCLQVYEDKGNRLTLGQIMELDAKGAFAPLDGSSSFGYSKSGFWFRLEVVNPTHRSVDWVLEYPYAVADHVAFHFPGKDGYQTKISGDRHPFDVRPVDFRTSAVYLNTLPGNHAVYVKIASLGAVVAPLTGWSRQAFERHRHFDTAVNWLYFGIMIATIVLCLFIYFTLGDMAFAFLMIYVFGSTLFVLSHTGVGFQYLWPRYPGWANLCHPLSAFIAMIGALQFSRFFLNTPCHSPLFDRIFTGITLISVVFLVSACFLSYALLTQMSVMGIGATAIAMVACGIVILKKKVRQAKFYLLAWSPFAVGVLVMGIKSYGMLENNLVTDSLIQISSVSVTFLFVFGLVDKVNTYRLEREAALEKLNRSERQFRMLADNVRDVIWRLALPGLKLTYITPSIKDIMGYSSDEALGLFSFEKMLPEEESKKVMEIIDRRMKKTDRDTWEGNDFTIEIRAIHKNGSLFWTETSATFVRDTRGDAVEMIGVTRDITERKAAEKAQKALEYQLHQSGKLEAIGTLAGGIAHDMNNIMAAVLGYAELCFQNAKPDSRMHHRLGRIIKASHRARDLVRQILTFSRQESAQARPIELSLILKEILALIRASLPSTISIETDIREKDLVVNADPTQVHQVVMNLCSNAGYAMMTEGGILSMVLDKAMVDKNNGAYPELAPGGYARLMIRDTGQGMEKAVIEKIFDPFFTTKPVGEGTGLGLSMIHGIVKNIGGSIYVRSEPGQGSEFQVFLPLAEHCGAPPENRMSLEDLPRGNERILYVDDEDDVVEMAVEMLSDLGYQVTGKQSGREALEVLTEGHPADLLITDQVMPGITGTQLVAAAQKMRPRLKAILSTGYNERDKSGQALLQQGLPLLRKPYAIQELALKVRQVLDQK